MEKKRNFLSLRGRRFKVLLCMKLLAFLLLVGTLGATASGNAQNSRITLNMKKVALEDVLLEIHEQTGVLFLYKSADIKSVKNLKVKLSDAFVEDVLRHCLKNTKLEYEFKNKAVVIRKAPAKVAKQDDRKKKFLTTISGTVVDEEGVPLPGAAIAVKGNALMGTVTNADGKFLMSNVPVNALIEISFIGTNSVQLSLKKLSDKERKDLKITLKNKDTDLDEVIVTGHGTQRKVSVTASITTVKPESLKTPTRSLSTQLAGRVAGVSFRQETGQPGKDGAQFIIRGISSVTGNTSPLVLIDGFKRSLDDVDPNDVKSFSILKDASATAIYGLEGANGILVITTKSGKPSSKPRVKTSYSSSFNSSTYKPKWLNSAEYAKIHNEARAVRGYDPLYSDEIIAKFADDDNDFYPNTDWYDLIVKPLTFSQKANFNINGGSNSVTYYLSGGYYSEDGMFDAKIGELNANANFNQFNFRSNITADLTATTTINLGLNGRYGKTREPGVGADKMIERLYSINPTLFPHEYSNGDIPEEPAGVENPWALLTRTGYQEHFSNRMSTNLDLTQKLDFITKGLFAKVMVSFSNDTYYSHVYEKAYQTYNVDYANSYMNSGRDEDGNLLTIPVLDAGGNTVNEDMSFKATANTGNRVTELQGTLNYNRTFKDKWYVSGLVLYKQRSQSEANPKGKGAALLINALPIKTQSLAARASVDYKHRYFADFSFGMSGSQMFTPDKRFSSFPSAGIGWLLSEEPFFTNVKRAISVLKLRASYGSVGSSGSAARFGYLAKTGPYTGYTFGYGYQFGSKGIGGLGQTQVPQNDLTWERVYKTNLALDIEFFGHLKLITEFYRDRRKSQLVKLYNIPATVGLPGDRPKANLGEMLSEGIDIDLTYHHSFGDFRINAIKFIAGYNRNEIIENGQNDPNMPYQSAIGLDWGRPLRLISLGLFKDQADIDASPVQTFSNKVLPGDIKYKDINGDGIVNNEDRIYVGNQNPHWTYSLSFDFGYKNWVLATRFIGKADMYRTIGGSRIPFNTNNNSGAVFSTPYGDHWTPSSYSGTTATENPNAEYPRLGFNGATNINNSQNSTFWMREASYVKMADLELGYRLTPKNKSWFRNIYAYVRGQNLFVISKFDDWNPEQNNGYAYPLKRTFSLGIEIAL
ncbi:SusC/RagA family TonB-linked outer membrane protein [Prolixibacteraceae bacterium JC049]|nr:SusC/RagA family TonB-linked outer membrane protein [Prolixibacteraceae bacterium JC049]